MRFFESLQLRRFAKESGAPFLDLDNCKDVEPIYAEQVRAFKRRSKEKISFLSSLQKVLRDIYESGKITDEVIARAYDAEYQTNNYAYLNALLVRRGFERITGYASSGAPSLTILDIGAGSNEFLRFCHAELGVPAIQLFGADISAVSVQIIKQDGFNACLGRAEQLQFPNASFDLVLLSYFIDYDTNQRATFGAAVRLLKPGGILVFEGLLPCKSLHRQERAGNAFITRGRSSIEDTRLICAAIESIGREQSCTILLQRVALGRRYIYNRFGFKRRSSHFLVFSKK
ncbi:MAG TPA: class I SAM-dependent methyltransferase [Candidatus Paceibacterota bacterium]